GASSRGNLSLLVTSTANCWRPRSRRCCAVRALLRRISPPWRPALAPARTPDCAPAWSRRGFWPARWASGQTGCARWVGSPWTGPRPPPGPAGGGNSVGPPAPRRKEVYWARYSPAGERLSGPEVARPAELPAGFPVAGAGAALYPELAAQPVPPRH